jgi:hypothetical protein
MKYRTKALLIGVVIGAIFGAVLGLISSDGYDEASSTEKPIDALGVGDYLTLGISMLSLARQFGGLLKRM